MSDESRRAAFRSFYERHYRGDRARFLEKTGYSKARLTQILNANEPFGEEAASNVAARLGLDPEYFNRAAAELALDRREPMSLERAIEVLEAYMSSAPAHNREGIAGLFNTFAMTGKISRRALRALMAAPASDERVDRNLNRDGRPPTARDTGDASQD